MTEPSKLSTYNAQDCVVQRRLYDQHTQHLERLPNGPELHSLLTTLQLIADPMCFRGIRVDPDRRTAHGVELTKRIGIARTEFLQLAQATDFSLSNHQLDGSDDDEDEDLINTSSTRQLCTYFFDHLGALATKYSDKTGNPSLDESVLTGFLTDGNPLIKESARSLLKIRKWENMLRTHVNGLPVDLWGCVHPIWRPGGAVTGRWASSSPNLMNIPKPVEEPVKDAVGNVVVNAGGAVELRVIHPGLRDMYIPVEKGNWIVGADYSQIELRIVAMLAGDEVYLRLFERGDDPHSDTAWDLFYTEKKTRVITRANVTESQRDLAKTFVYLAMYGGDARKLWESLVVKFPSYTIGAAREHLRRWQKAHPKIKKWQDGMRLEAKTNGNVYEYLSGRHRYFWGPVNPNEALNFPVQTAAGHVINQAIQKVNEGIKWGKEGILIQLHDALYLEGPNPLKLAENLLQMETKLSHPNGYEVSLPVELSVGKDSGNLKKVKNLKDLRSL